MVQFVVQLRSAGNCQGGTVGKKKVSSKYAGSLEGISCVLPKLTSDVQDVSLVFTKCEVGVSPSKCKMKAALLTYSEERGKRK